jgi:hypothetical protein
MTGATKEQYITIHYAIPLNRVEIGRGHTGREEKRHILTIGY